MPASVRHWLGSFRKKSVGKPVAQREAERERRANHDRAHGIVNDKESRADYERNGATTGAASSSRRTRCIGMLALLAPWLAPRDPRALHASDIGTAVLARRMMPKKAQPTARRSREHR